jgi:DNA modification methylase
MPESVNNRCAKSHEYIFLLTKSPKYVFNPKAIAQPITPVSRRRYEAVVKKNERFNAEKHKHTSGVQSPMEILTRTAPKMLADGTRKERSVWTIPTGGNAAAGHFATFPQALPDKCILAGSNEGDIVLDPFSGSGTTGIAAKWRRRKYIGLELNPNYVKLSVDRLSAAPDAERTLFSEDTNDK